MQTTTFLKRKMKKYIASQKVVYQINDNEFETVTESQVFDETDTFAKLKKWADRKSYHFYKSSAIQVMELKDMD
jgi:hypothetical protein